MTNLFPKSVFSFPEDTDKAEISKFFEKMEFRHRGMYGHRMTFTLINLQVQLKLGKKDLSTLFNDEKSEEQPALLKPTKEEFLFTLLN